MTIRKIVQMMGAGAAIALFSLSAQANLLANADFEGTDTSGGDVYGAAEWSPFGSVFSTQTVANSGVNSLKTFGGGAGASQRFAAAEGDIFAGSALVQNYGQDAMVNPGQAFVQIKYLRADGTTLAGAAANGFDAIGFNIFNGNAIDFNSPQDQWLSSGVGGPAPDLTAFVDFIVLGLNPAGGASFFDDASFDQVVIPVPAAVWLFGSGLVGLIGVARRRKQA